MEILTMISVVSIAAMLSIFTVLIVKSSLPKSIKIFGCMLIPLVFIGATILIATVGEIERLRKEKVEKYEEVTYTVYKKI